jgi:hypothetical protein
MNRKETITLKLTDHEYDTLFDVIQHALEFKPQTKAHKKWLQSVRELELTVNSVNNS